MTSPPHRRWFQFNLRTLSALHFCRIVGPIAVASVCLFSGCTRQKSFQELGTRRLLQRLAGETEMMMITNHKMPEGGFAGLLREIDKGMSDDYIQHRRLNFPTLEAGTDLWNRPIIIADDQQGIITFRSMGAEGIDNAGGGDDIQERRDCRKYIRTDNGT